MTKLQKKPTESHAAYRPEGTLPNGVVGKFAPPPSSLYSK